MEQQKLWSKYFIAVVGSSLFMSWGFYATTPTLPIYLVKNLGIEHGSLGLVLGVFSIVSIAVRPLAGYLIDNYHRAGIMIAALALMTGAYGVYPLVGTVFGLLVLRSVHGALWGIATSASAPVVGDIVPPSRLGAGIGIYAMCTPVGMTLGPVFGLDLLKAYGPYVMFLGILGVSLVSSIFAYFTRASSKPPQKKKFSFLAMFHKNAVPIALCMFFIIMAYGAIIVFVGVYAGQKNFSHVGAFFLCFAAAIFLSRMFCGRLFDEGRILFLIGGGHLLAAAGMLWLGYAWSPAQFLAAGAVGGLGFGMLLPAAQAAINAIVDANERGAANSTYLISYDLGIGISSLAIGSLLTRVSLAVIYRCSALLIVLSAAMFILMAIPHYNRSRRS